jgi:hypothetical protein
MSIRAMLALVTLAAGDSVTTQILRAVPHPTTHVGVFGAMITTEGNSVVHTDVRMQRSQLPNIVANAEYMSLGPPGPWIPDTTSGPGFHVENPTSHRLRVTLGSSERITWLLIDDVVTGRADSRWVAASYMFSPFDGSGRDLWSAVQKAPRVLGSDPEGPPITWISPTSFAWITRSDTLVFEQKADSLFNVTLRARVR